SRVHPEVRPPTRGFHCTSMDAKRRKSQYVPGFYLLSWISLDVLKLGNGGEGGIRTPDRLTPMSDFESGAFNRALPPLRYVTYYINYLRIVLRLIAFAAERWVSVLVSLRFPAFTSRSTADAWCSGARW